MFVEPFLKSRQWDIKLDIAKNEVVITCPYKDEYLAQFDLKPVGTRTVTLDCSKGMAPLRSTLDFRYESKGGSRWRRETFVMDDLRKVADVWIPFRYSELIRSTALGDGRCNTRETKILQARIGGVDKSQLAVEFPPGTMVVDALKGEWYTAGDDGGPREEPKPLAKPPEPQVQAQAERGFGYLFWINAAVVVSLAVVVVGRRVVRRHAT